MMGGVVIKAGMVYNNKGVAVAIDWYIVTIWCWDSVLTGASGSLDIDLSMSDLNGELSLCSGSGWLQ